MWLLRLRLAGMCGGVAPPRCRESSADAPIGSFRHRLSRALSPLRIDRPRSARRLCADQRNPRRALARGHEPGALRRSGRWHRTGQRDRDGLARGRHREESRRRVAQPVRADGRRRRQTGDAAADRTRRPANPSGCPARYSRTPVAAWCSKPRQGIEALRCSGLAESFSFAPSAASSATPDLSVLVRSARAADRRP